MELTRSKIGRVYGHKPSPPDIRDIHYHDTVSDITVPAKQSWLEFMGPVKDQGSEGCCTGESSSYMREFLTLKWVRPKTFVQMSPQFIYQNAVQLDGDNLVDDPGATCRSTMQVLNTKGVCPVSEDPVDPSKLTVMPTDQNYKDALNYKAGVYKGLYSLNDIRHCIASGFVCVIGFTVYSSFESDSTAATGIMTMPKPGEEVLGGHAVCIFGYDDTYVFPDGSKGALLIRNSWGAGWGDKGNFYMPYAYLTSGNVSEAWMIHLGPMWT